MNMNLGDVKRLSAMSNFTITDIRPSLEKNSQTDWLNQAFKQLQKSSHTLFL